MSERGPGPDELTLSAFLLACIGEDEALATAAVGTAAFSHQTGRWSFARMQDRYGEIPVVFALADGGGKTQVARLDEAWEPIERGRHIARHDPARVLAECAAKRRIVEWHRNWPVLVQEPPTIEQGDARGDVTSLTLRMSQRMAWVTEQEYRNRFGTEPPTGPVLRLLAAVYADRPGYREEWRP